MHSSYQQRPQQANYTRNTASGAMSNRAGENNSSGMSSNVVNSNNTSAAMTPRQAAQPHQQQSAQQNLTGHMVFQQPVLLPYTAFPNQRIPYMPTGHNHYQYVSMPHLYSMVPQQPHRSNAGTAHAIQTGTPIGANVGAKPVGGANTQQLQHPAQHQAQINQHPQHYLQQPAVNQTAMNVGTGMNPMYSVTAQPQPKQAKKILEIIDPKTGQNILDDYKSNKPSSSGSSGSASLTIEPPHAQPPEATTASLNQLDVSHEINIVADTAPGATVESAGGRYRWPFTGDAATHTQEHQQTDLVTPEAGFEIPLSENTSAVRKTGSARTSGVDKFTSGQRTTHEIYNLEQREQLNDVPPQPHTPVVSAIADGPSVDIPPKQSKNVKRK